LIAPAPSPTSGATRRRDGAPRRPSLGALLLLALAAGLGSDCERSCRSGTLFLDVDLGTARGAASLAVDIVIAGQTQSLTQTLPPGASRGGLEVGFENGYVDGAAATVTVTAETGGVALATETRMITLASGCSHESFTLGAIDGGTGGATGAGGHPAGGAGGGTTGAGGHPAGGAGGSGSGGAGAGGSGGGGAGAGGAGLGGAGLGGSSGAGGATLAAAGGQGAGGTGAGGAAGAGWGLAGSGAGGATGAGGNACAGACTVGATMCQSGTSLATCSQSLADGCPAFAASTCAAGLVCERAAPASCADPNWAEWPVPPATSPTNYTDNHDGTVTDTVTGLMWQQLNSTVTPWAQAASYCQTLALGSYGDWRLPTKIELISILDFGIAMPGPTINATAFPAASAGYYWSSTRVAGSSQNVWTVNFYGGYTAMSATSNAEYIRCVR
jgi:hypothetical protein